MSSIGLQNGDVVGGYRIESLLGEGGMGAVYEATQLSLNRTVALKVIRPDLTVDLAFRERFRREALHQAALEHPNILTVYEAGESPFGLFFAMRLVRGPTLKDLIVARELNPHRTLTIFAQIADALDAAHEAGLVHRDVKPQNILVDTQRRDHAFLGDFGVIKAAGLRSLTKTGQIVGTLDYISPEEIKHDGVTAASDIYSLSAVLYECLTGVVPFPKASDAAVLFAHMSDPPPRVTEQRPELPEALDGVLRRGMAKEPADRFGSGAELIQHVEAALGQRLRSLIAPPPPIQVPEEVGVRRPEHKVATPVLSLADVAPAAPAPAPRDTPVQPAAARRRLPRRLLALLPAVLAIALVAGYLAARATRPAAAAATVADGGLVSLTAPEEWQLVTPAPPVPGVPLADRAAVAAGGTTVVVGTLAARGPAFLPRALGGRPRRELVRVGRVEAFRYRVAALTLYVLPGTAGVGGVACLAGAPRTCDRVVAAARLRRGTPFPLADIGRISARLNAITAKLNGSRRTALRAMRKARKPAAQAASAAVIALAYGRARAQVAALPAPAVLRAPTRAVVASLSAARQAYVQLSGAAAAKKAHVFAAARRRTALAEAHVRRALRGFAPYGVSVR